MLLDAQRFNRPEGTENTTASANAEAVVNNSGGEDSNLRPPGYESPERVFSPSLETS